MERESFDEVEIRNRAMLDPKHKEQERIELEEKVAEYLARGREIEVVPGFEEGRKYEHLTDDEKKRISKTANTKKERMRAEYIMRTGKKRGSDIAKMPGGWNNAAGISGKF